MAKTTKRTETAPEAYSRLSAAIDMQIKTLNEALAAHRKKHEASPKNWGYAGELGHVRAMLEQINAFLTPPVEDDVHCDHSDGCCREDMGLACDDRR